MGAESGIGSGTTKGKGKLARDRFVSMFLRAGHQCGKGKATALAVARVNPTH